MKSREAPHHKAPQDLKQVTANGNRERLPRHPDASTRPVALMGPVKPGAGQDQAGCFQAGQAGSGAPRHHEPPDKQVAVKPGTVSPDPSSTVPMSGFSKGFAVPIEKDDRCGTTGLWRLEGGRLRAARLDCRVKRCPNCGPKLREGWAGLWAQVLAGEVIHRLVIDEGEWRKLQRRKVMRGHELGYIPAPDDQRAIYTTAPIGSICEDIPSALTSDFAEMPNDGRHKGLSAGWRRRAECIEAFTAPATRADGPRVLEFLGILRSGLEHARQLAREMKLYEEEAGVEGSAFILRQPDDPLDWRRF
jgi:hypothetical protein